MYILTVYVPLDHVDHVKTAMFGAGAGRIGPYDCCAWQTLGEGQFRPLDGSRPFFGTTNQIEKVPEVKIEMVCANHCLEDVLEAMRHAHPYETPAYHVVQDARQ